MRWFLGAYFVFSYKGIYVIQPSLYIKNFIKRLYVAPFEHLWLSIASEIPKTAIKSINSAILYFNT